MNRRVDDAYAWWLWSWGVGFCAGLLVFGSIAVVYVSWWEPAPVSVIERVVVLAPDGEA